MKNFFDRFAVYFFAAALLLCACFSDAQTVSPFMGIGNAQFFDNNGEPLTAGVLYSYQAGTTTQQATYTDSTGLTQNPNPIPFSSGARVTIWLTATANYKFVLCLQNDGAFCAPADVLFSMDHVPGGATGGGGGGSPFTGIFISNSPLPATTGILELASIDSICWRNTANNANLCISKDAGDVLTWAGGAIKAPETGAYSAGAGGFDYLWADSSVHRWKMANNGSTAVQVVASGVDVNTSDQVTQLHFGSSAAPLGTAPTLNQYLRWNGSSLVGAPTESTFGSGISTYLPGSATYTTCGGTGPTQACVETVFAASHTLLRFTWNLAASPSGCSTNPIIGVRDLTAGSNLYTVTVNAQPLGFQDSGAVSVAIPAGDVIGVGVLTAPAAPCAVALVGITMVYQ